mmetsp:Transcript_9149/g.22420  ORF Transcript_9149/g.22420 Transcript_9149/m.22420 type:complete len:212 (-) Transcript_9149:1029-1664(-)
MWRALARTVIPKSVTLVSAISRRRSSMSDCSNPSSRWDSMDFDKCVRRRQRAGLIPPAVADFALLLCSSWMSLRSKEIRSGRLVTVPLMGMYFSLVIPISSTCSAGMWAMPDGWDEVFCTRTKSIPELWAICIGYDSSSMRYLTATSGFQYGYPCPSAFIRFISWYAAKYSGLLASISHGGFCFQASWSRSTYFRNRYSKSHSKILFGFER